jgi:hypothetical protein
LTGITCEASDTTKPVTLLAEPKAKKADKNKNAKVKVNIIFFFIKPLNRILLFILFGKRRK